jgi:hypothetical protein
MNQLSICRRSTLHETETVMMQSLTGGFYTTILEPFHSFNFELYSMSILVAGTIIQPPGDVVM